MEQEQSLNAVERLNTLAIEFPSAISLAAGRPLEATFGLSARLRTLVDAIDSGDALVAVDAGRRVNDLGQYGAPAGVIRAAIARHLAIDEGMDVDPEAVVVTSGAQEALLICLVTLFDPARDALLVTDPTYVGVIAIAQRLGVRLAPVELRDNLLDPSAIERTIAGLPPGMRARALYVVADFSNPLGETMSRSSREAVLEICRRQHVLVIEDNPYGLFAYDDRRLPTLKALDRGGQVIYVGTFSKAICPGVRVGYLVADGVGETKTAAAALARVKGALTINTSPVMQALVAQALSEAGGSLATVAEQARLRYRQHRNATLLALQDAFGSVDGVSWSHPRGGFFLRLTVPFAFSDRDVIRCAGEGVLVMPMRAFCLTKQRDDQLRVSFSAEEPPAIREGIRRLAAYVRGRDSQPSASPAESVAANITTGGEQWQ